LETAIWVIGLVAAVVIIVIYIITSVNKYSNSFVGKYFNEEGKSNSPESDTSNANIEKPVDDKLNIKEADPVTDAGKETLDKPSESE